MIIKFTNGETILADLKESMYGVFKVHRPVQVRMVPSIGKNGEVSENPIVTMYCQFSPEEDYEFKQEQILYCKKLYQKIEEFYVSTADNLYSIELTKVNVKDANASDLFSNHDDDDEVDFLKKLYH